MRKLAIAATIVICLATASSAAAKTPRAFFGVIPANDPTAAEFQRLGAAKTGTVRTNLLWPVVQGLGPAFYDWSRYDTLVGLAAANGIRVLPTIYGSPGWAAASPERPPRAQFRDEFEAFVRAAAERYGPGGTFWLLNPTIPALPIVDWQLWNEVNSPTFWGQKPSAKSYLPLLQAAHRGLKGVNPGSRLVLAGLFRDPRIKRSVTASRYLRALYRIGGRPFFDAVAIHPYAFTPRIGMDAVEQARLLMRRFGDRKKPIWITEVGWASGGRRTPLTVSPKVQGKYLRGIFKLAAAKRKQLRINGVIWYSLKDLPGSNWVNHTGLFTRSGAAKPSWRAFVRLTGGKK